MKLLTLHNSMPMPINPYPHHPQHSNLRQSDKRKSPRVKILNLQNLRIPSKSEIEWEKTKKKRCKKGRKESDCSLTAAGKDSLTCPAAENQLASQRNNNNWTTNEVVNLKANIKNRGYHGVSKRAVHPWSLGWKTLFRDWRIWFVNCLLSSMSFQAMMSWI